MKQIQSIFILHFQGLFVSWAWNQHPDRRAQQTYPHTIKFFITSGVGQKQVYHTTCEYQEHHGYLEEEQSL
jgi:hypothetical protein